MSPETIIPAKETTREGHLTREKILVAGKGEFAEKGFNGARMSAIARRAGTNQALIHYYFESKEGLYVEVLRRLFEGEPDSAIRDRIGSWQLSLPEQLYVALYLFTHIHRCVGDPDFARIITWEIAEGRAHLKTLMSRYFIPRIALFEDLIRRGVDEGCFRTDDTHFTVFSIIALVIFYNSSRDNYEGTPLFDRLYGGDAPDRFFVFMTDMIFRSLAPEGRTIPVPALSSERMDILDIIVDEYKKHHTWTAP